MKVFEELKQPHELKHVDTLDRSAPVIYKNVHIGKNPMREVFAELPAGKTLLAHNKLMSQVGHPPELNHVETVDKSTPLIENDIHIGKAPQKQVFEEIKQHQPALHHCDTVDKSAPRIEKNVHIHEAPQVKLFEQIRKRQPAE